MLDLTPLNVPKASAVLADLLRSKILSGEFEAGSSLPTEREIVEQVGLSRATVREALRSLESDGLVAIRTGRNGGAFVLRPGRDVVERSIHIFIRGQRIRLDAVAEVRSAVEPASARFAALHRTEEDLAEIERCQCALEAAAKAADLQGFVQANLNWHVSVVRASHNELLVAFISALSKPFYDATDVVEINTQENRAAAIHAHRKVIDAIRDGDGEAAERRMVRHVGAYREQLEAQAKANAAGSSARRSKLRKGIE